MLSTSASQTELTQFTQLPAWKTPTENVQSSVVIPSISATFAAIAAMADRPSDSAQPAWLGRPRVWRSKRAMA